MTLQEHDYAQITERLVTDFQEQVPLETLISVLRTCAAGCPTDAAEPNP